MKKTYEDMVAYKVAIVVWKIAYKIKWSCSEGCLLHRAMGKVISRCVDVVQWCIDKDIAQALKRV